MSFINKESLLWKIIHNAFRFLISLSFIIVFQTLFGVENTLLGVAISVGFTMLPMCNLDIKPWTMFWIIVILYGGSTFVAQLSACLLYTSYANGLFFTCFIS